MVSKLTKNFVFDCILIPSNVISSFGQGFLKLSLHVGVYVCVCVCMCVYVCAQASKRDNWLNWFLVSLYDSYH